MGALKGCNHCWKFQLLLPNTQWCGNILMSEVRIYGHRILKATKACWNFETFETKYLLKSILLGNETNMNKLIKFDWEIIIFGSRCRLWLARTQCHYNTATMLYTETDKGLDFSIVHMKVCLYINSWFFWKSFTVKHSV